MSSKQPATPLIDRLRCVFEAAMDGWESQQATPDSKSLAAVRTAWDAAMAAPPVEDPLPNIVVTEIITHVRVWRVPAVSVRDAVNRIIGRDDRTTQVVCVSNEKQTRWAGAAGNKLPYEYPKRGGRPSKK